MLRCIKAARAKTTSQDSTMTTLMQDLQYALRQLKKTPGFTITVLLTLALGIGANAAIFTLVNSVLLKNLPVADPNTLVRLGNNSHDCCVGFNGVRDNPNYSNFSTDTYQQLKKNVPEFAELAAMQAGFTYRPIVARRDGANTEAHSVMGEFVSGNYFTTFGLRPTVGRLFLDSDDVPGVAATAVLSYHTWQHEFGGDPAVVGSTLWVNTKPVTVVGVAPSGFYGDRLTSTPPDYYLPIETMGALANAPYVHEPQTDWLYMVGRVKPGVAMGALQEKVNAVVRQVFATQKAFQNEQGKKALPKVRVMLTPGGAGIQVLREEYESQLRLLMSIAGLVLLIACANIANLLLVRGMGRRAEMSVRTALGAMRGRIVRQLLTESILLAGMGGLAGLAVAYAGTHFLLMLAFPGAENVPIGSGPSPAVIGFAFGVSMLTGILFGLAPAWITAQAEPVDALRSGARTTATGASLLQKVLVVLQAALSLVLLVGAGLFSQNLNKLQSMDLKLVSTNRYMVHINPQAAGYSQTQLEVLYRTMEERFHAVPGVVKVGISNYTPMEDNNWSNSIGIQGEPDPHHTASFIKANADYFDSVGTRILMGRGIRVQDASTAPPVTVVNQAFVKQFFKDKNPIGRRIGSTDSPGDFEIVGVVEDTAYTDVRWKNHSMFFVPIMQRYASDKEPMENDMSLYAGAIVIETSHPMSDMEGIARRTLGAINPNLTVVKFQTFDDQIADRFTQERLVSRLMALFGGLALLLATIGLYGVTAYSVVRRTPEIGVRMALGADRLHVIAMIMRGAAWQAALGLAIGVPVALLLVRFVESQLYEITSPDSYVMIGAIVTLALAACLAGIVPARRAASIDPVQALRSE
jgi:macrolide transport system ATP-binding/permease protein